MKKKLLKYIKFFVNLALILSLVAPSYASLSASDGSAFVTKAEFDSALADFNSRLTTFEAGINSKIDSQVTSYLDRNGIWSGAEQDFWQWWEDPNYISSYLNASGHASWKTSYQLWDSHLAGWSPVLADGWARVTPIIQNVSKSGLLFYTIQLIWFGSANAKGYEPLDTFVSFCQTPSSNIKRVYSNTPTAFYVHKYSYNGPTTIKNPQNGLSGYFGQLYAGTTTFELVSQDLNKVTYTNASLPIQTKLLQWSTDSRVVTTAGAVADTDYYKFDVQYFTTDTSNKYFVGGNTTVFNTAWSIITANDSSLQPPLTAELWTWNSTTGKSSWSTPSNSDVVLFSGNLFVSKGQPLLCQFGCAYIMYYIDKNTPLSNTRVRESGTAARLCVY